MKTVLDYLQFSNPTKDQVNVLNGIENFIHPMNGDNFLIIQGAAGTGKTSIISALVDYLNVLDNPYSIAAPTGRAARIIGKKVNSSATTIHAMIFTPDTDRDTGKVCFNLKQRFDANPTVYIIDESSMLSSKSLGTEVNFGSELDVLSSTIKYIFTANIKNKVIFIGDTYQLPPVGEEKACALDNEYLEKRYALKGSVYVLSEVKRQEDGSYILENATDIRNAIDKGLTSHTISGTKSRSIYASSVNFSKNLKSKGPTETIALGVSHKANKFFNDLVRNELFGKHKQLIEKGDIMMLARNWSRNNAVLNNGDQLEIIDVVWGSMENVSDLHFVPIKFRPLFSDEVFEDILLIESVTNLGAKIETEKELKLTHKRYIKNPIFRNTQNPEDDKYVGALRLMYGYAITCHKAQGGEWNKVIINSMGIPNLKWQYTAVTRGISQIEHF